MRRVVGAVLVLVMALQVAGCEAIQRKFTRKKKREIIKPRFYQEDGAETRPHLELYMMHYTYWKSWQEELITRGGSNAKRDLMACNELMGHLADMKKYLTGSKAEELEKTIVELSLIEPDLKKQRLTKSQKYKITKFLEKIKRHIDKNFSYADMKEFLELYVD